MGINQRAIGWSVRLDAARQKSTIDKRVNKNIPAGVDNTVISRVRKRVQCSARQVRRLAGAVYGEGIMYGCKASTFARLFTEAAAPRMLPHMSCCAVSADVFIVQL